MYKRQVYVPAYWLISVSQDDKEEEMAGQSREAMEAAGKGFSFSFPRHKLYFKKMNQFDFLKKFGKFMGSHEPPFFVWFMPISIRYICPVIRIQI